MKMAQFRREEEGRYCAVYRGDPVNLSALVGRVQNPDRRLTAGRGAPGVFELNGKTWVSRQFLHGGWLRGITRGLFFGEKRAAEELKITVYLEERGFPVISAVGFVSQKGLVGRHLFFVSVLLENAHDLVDHFRSANRRERLRMSKKLAAGLFELGRLGVYHPDLHLRNVLVTAEGKLFFLDFDRAYHKKITPADYEKMFWRLDRFARKYAALFGRAIDDRERLLFLRTYERLSGHEIISKMRENRSRMEHSARLGWFIDRLFYSRKD